MTVFFIFFLQFPLARNAAYLRVIKCRSLEDELKRSPARSDDLRELRLQLKSLLGKCLCPRIQRIVLILASQPNRIRFRM